jgi:hypothetical protein
VKTGFTLVLGDRCPDCEDRAIVRGKNRLGDPCWMANAEERVELEIAFCPFCGFDLREAMGEVVSSCPPRGGPDSVPVVEVINVKLAPFVVHLEPDEWAFIELEKQWRSKPDRKPVLRLVVEQGSPPKLSDVYITFRAGEPTELREKGKRLR